MKATETDSGHVQQKEDLSDDINYLGIKRKVVNPNLK